MNEELQRIKEKIEVLHASTKKSYDEPTVSSALRAEYKRGYEQYQSMYDSIEMFKGTATKEGAEEGLLAQQIKILQNWINFELEMKEKVKGNANEAGV